MSIFFSPLNGTNHYASRIFILLICLTALISLFAPRFMGSAPGVIALTGCIFWRIEKTRWPVFNINALIIVTFIVAISALSSLWAIDSDFALKRSMKIMLVLGPATLLFSLATQVRTEGQKLFSALFPFFIGLAGLFCVIDLYAGGALYSITHENKTPEEIEFNLSLLNRNIIIFTSLILPALYAVHIRNHEPKHKVILYSMLLIPLALILYQTHSQSAQIAVLIAAFIWFAFPVQNKTAWFALGTALFTGIISAPWIVQFLYDNVAQHVTGFDHWFAHAYAAHRLEIWDFVARKALENPLYGFGIEATRHIEQFDTQKLYTPHDHVLHPHNGIIQIWIEFGALGITCLLAFITYILQKIWQLKSLDDRRFALAVFISLFLIANTAYGLWQGWWLGLIAFMITCVILLCKSKENKL